ncbi:MAG: metallophosphoesterase [Treponema sp.]|jgi:hypothetical protein|nr:metallophosphoesterase [Treponema sp.]
MKRSPSCGARLAAAAASLLVLAASCADPLEAGSEWTPSDVFNADDYARMTKQAGISFRILQVADVHLDDPQSDDARALRIIQDAVQRDRPDLIVLTGDNIFNQASNYAPAVRLIHFLDTLETPYALVLGNHDGQGVFNNEKITEIYSAGKNALFTRGPSNIPGCGNYGINLVDEAGNILYAFVCIDSNKHRYILGYDCIYPQQIAWYEWYIEGISAARRAQDPAAAVVKSLAFFHIPLPEIDDARRQLKAEDPAGERFAFRENPTPPKVNSGMFQKMKALQSTTHIFNGHDHVNVLDYVYQGIHFVYGLKTGPNGYHDEDRMGTTLITINNDLSVQVYFNYAGE